MKIISLIIVSVLLVVSAIAVPMTIEEYEKKFGEYWNDPEDLKAAAAELAKAEAEIAAADAENPQAEKLNELSAIPKDEFESEKLGLKEHESYAMGLLETPEEMRINSPEDQAYLDAFYSSVDRSTYEPEFDGRQHGLITPVKNQGNCGSCAAFAATAVHESCLAYAGVPLEGLDLSEQELVDCGYNGDSMNACKGAWLGAYQDWMVGQDQKGRHAHEADYPYQDRDPNYSCQAKPKWSSGAIIDEAVVDYGCNEEKLIDLLVHHGAVATGIYASDSGFKNNDLAVFDQCTSSRINHAVVVVGYGTDATGKDYWTIKNSWGEHWGDGGYTKIARGQGMCGIGGNCAVTKCKWVGGATPAPVAPPPPPIPANQFCDITEMYGPGIDGTVGLRTKVNGKEYTSTVDCKNSICTPTNPGPSNCCMYICGKISC